MGRASFRAWRIGPAPLVGRRVFPADVDSVADTDTVCQALFAKKFTGDGAKRWGCKKKVFLWLLPGVDLATAFFCFLGFLSPPWPPLPSPPHTPPYLLPPIIPLFLPRWGGGNY